MSADPTWNTALARQKQARELHAERRLPEGVDCLRRAAALLLALEGRNSAGAATLPNSRAAVKLQRSRRAEAQAVAGQASAIMACLAHQIHGGDLARIRVAALAMLCQDTAWFSKGEALYLRALGIAEARHGEVVAERLRAKLDGQGTRKQQCCRRPVTIVSPGRARRSTPIPAVHCNAGRVPGRTSGTTGPATLSSAAT